MSNHHIPKFLQRKTDYPTSRAEARSPRWNRDPDHCSSITFISPKAKDKNGDLNLGKAIQRTNQGKVIILTQESCQLKRELNCLKQERLSYSQENYQLKEKLKETIQEINCWKQKSMSFQYPNVEASTFEDSAVDFNLLSAINNPEYSETMQSVSVDIDEVYPDNEFHAIVNKNDILEESLSTANKLIAKMRSQGESLHMNLRIMQRKLQAKDKEMAKYRAKRMCVKGNLFDLSDDQS